MSEKNVTTKEDLRESIQQSWDHLTKALERLTNEQLTTVKDDQGWTIQDHIAHLTVWEQSVLSALRGKERYQGLGVDEATFLAHDYDKMNDQIYQRHKNLSLKTIIDQSHAIHNQLLDQIEAMNDVELSRPYRNFLPANSKDEDDRFMIDVIHGNTAGHYEEHLEWIERLVNG